MKDRVLFVCTGNQCRSPMAAALLQTAVCQSARISVTSAGFVTQGIAPPPGVIDAMASIGVDLSEHRSRLITNRLLASSSLIVAMARQHLVDLAVSAPTAWPISFTFADLLRRGDEIGRRQPGESLADWSERVGTDRKRKDVLRLPLAEDVADPMGGAVRDYERTRDRLSEMVERLAMLLQPA